MAATPPGIAGSQAATAPQAMSWATVLALNEPWLRRVVLLRTGEAQAVDEVIQEVGLAAAKSPQWPGPPGGSAASRHERGPHDGGGAGDAVVGGETVGAPPAGADPKTAASGMAAWLYRVAVRQALLYRRRRGRRRRLDGNYTRHVATAHGSFDAADPLRWLLKEERAGLVRIALSRLPGRDADVLILKYTEQWSYRQLAEHLGATEAAIETRLHRARQRLREELKRLDPHEDAT